MLTAGEPCSPVWAEARQWAGVQTSMLKYKMLKSQKPSRATVASHDNHKSKTARVLHRQLIQRKVNVREPAALPPPATTAIKEKPPE